MATGSRWSGSGVQAGTHEPIEGADAALAHVLTPEQVADEGKRPPGGSRWPSTTPRATGAAPGIAELLAKEGYETHLVTSLEVVSPLSDLTLEGPMLRLHLHELGVAMHRGVTIDRVEPGRISGENEFEEAFSLEVDGLVLVTQQISDDALYRELTGDPAGLEAAGIGAVYRIGDCVAPRMISEAIFDGHRLAREIDGPHPETPLPFDRERRIPESTRSFAEGATTFAAKRGGRWNPPGSSPVAYLCRTLAVARANAVRRFEGPPYGVLDLHPDRRPVHIATHVLPHRSADVVTDLGCSIGGPGRRRFDDWF